MACGKYVKMCAGVARAGLKSFVELVRLQTLSRQGLQQLQVDVHFLREHLRRCGSTALLDSTIGLCLIPPSCKAVPVR